MNDGGIASILANGSGEPLKSLFIHRIAGKQVSGVTQGHASIALELAPDLHPLTGPLRGQRERKQQPGNARPALCVHYYWMLDL